MGNPCICWIVEIRNKVKEINECVELWRVAKSNAVALQTSKYSAFYFRLLNQMAFQNV